MSHFYGILLPALDGLRRTPATCDREREMVFPLLLSQGAKPHLGIGEQPITCRCRPRKGERRGKKCASPYDASFHMLVPTALVFADGFSGYSQQDALRVALLQLGDREKRQSSVSLSRPSVPGIGASGSRSSAGDGMSGKLGLSRPISRSLASSPGPFKPSSALAMSAKCTVRHAMGERSARPVPCFGRMGRGVDAREGGILAPRRLSTA